MVEIGVGAGVETELDDKAEAGVVEEEERKGKRE